MVSFTMMSVRKFSKKNHENDKRKKFLKRASLVTLSTAMQLVTLTFRIER